MAFDKKKQEIFEKFIAAVEKKGSQFDFYKMAKAFDKFLSEKQGLTIKSNQFFREVWDELDDPRSRWSIPDGMLEVFLEAMPADMVKRNLTDEMIQRHIKPADHPKYEKLVANFKDAKAGFLVEGGLVGDNKVIITSRKKDSFVVKAYLGDIRSVIEVPEKLRSEGMYRDFYDAIEDEIGAKKCQKVLAEIVADFEVLDWPNISNLDDAVYEIEFFMLPDDELVEEVEAAVAFVIDDVFA